jgi:hypothetical protein
MKSAVFEYRGVTMYDFGAGYGFERLHGEQVVIAPFQTPPSPDGDAADREVAKEEGGRRIDAYLQELR